MNIDDFFADLCNKNAEGKLTVGEAVFGYYRLLEGEKAGKVIIKTNAKIDGERIIFFANGLTWAFVDKYKDVRCERVGPTFNQGMHAVDYSQATWCNDDSDVPQHHEW